MMFESIQNSPAPFLILFGDLNVIQNDKNLFKGKNNIFTVFLRKIQG